MFLPLTMSTTGPLSSSIWPSEARAAAGDPSTRIPARSKALTALAIARSETRRIRLATSPRTETANGIATRTAIPSANVRSGPTRPGRLPPSSPHDRRLLRGHSDPERLRARPAELDADPAQEGTVPHRHDDGGRRPFQLLHDLGSDRAVTLVLGLLGPVLEERQVLLGRVLRAGELGLVEIGARSAYVSTEALDDRKLFATRRRGHVNDRAQPEPLRRPGRRGAVVPCRGGDDGFRAALSERLKRGQSPAPLERSELVNILPPSGRAPGRARASREPARAALGSPEESRRVLGHDHVFDSIAEPGQRLQGGPGVDHGNIASVEKRANAVRRNAKLERAVAV
jgi:hypothetical protein